MMRDRHIFTGQLGSAPGMQEAGYKTRPDLRFYVEPPAGIEPATHPYHRWSARSGTTRHLAPLYRTPSGWPYRR
jgi:hypothetical protein